MKLKKKMIKKIIPIIFITITLIFAITNVTYATGEATLEQTKLVQGTENLIKAVVNVLVIVGVAVCGGYFIYYVFCLKTNDEGERRRNIQNIKNTLISIILITTGLALIDAILSFYK